MMGMSITEILVILALALLLFGPDELPKMAKSLGKGLRELRKASDDLRSTIETEMVKLDDDPAPPHVAPSILSPKVDQPPDDPGAARAAARFAAAGLPPPGKPTPPAALSPPAGTIAQEAKPPEPPTPPPSETT